jgi:hypothetical protein
MNSKTCKLIGPPPTPPNRTMRRFLCFKWEIKDSRAKSARWNKLMDTRKQLFDNQLSNICVTELLKMQEEFRS